MILFFIFLIFYKLLKIITHTYKLRCQEPRNKNYPKKNICPQDTHWKLKAYQIVNVTDEQPIVIRWRHLMEMNALHFCNNVMIYKITPAKILSTFFVGIFKNSFTRYYSNNYICKLIRENTEITRHHLSPEVRLRLITPNCKLWYTTEDHCPFQDPFWAFYWPGGQVLARWDFPVIKKKREKYACYCYWINESKIVFFLLLLLELVPIFLCTHLNNHSLFE